MFVNTPAKKAIHRYPDWFAPTIDLGLVFKTLGIWYRMGKPPIDPDFFERVLMSNPDHEQHLIWADEVVLWLKTEAKKKANRP